MTREEYGRFYERGFKSTVRLLISRGLYPDCAEETAQAAWVKGWQHLAQLRNESLVVTWVNSIALNVYRSVTRKPQFQELPDLPIAPRINLAAIDVERMLRRCKKHERMVLEQWYLEGLETKEIAQRAGWTSSAVRIRLLRARRSAKALLSRAA